MPSLDTIAAQFLDRMIMRMFGHHGYYRDTSNLMTDSEWTRLLAYALHCAMRYWRMYA